MGDPWLAVVYGQSACGAPVTSQEPPWLPMSEQSCQLGMLAYQSWLKHRVRRRFETSDSLDERRRGPPGRSEMICFELSSRRRGQRYPMRSSLSPTKDRRQFVSAGAIGRRQEHTSRSRTGRGISSAYLGREGARNCGRTPRGTVVTEVDRTVR